jgi:hypothetical protein
MAPRRLTNGSISREPDNALGTMSSPTPDLNSPPPDESAIQPESKDEKDGKDEKDDKDFKAAKAADVLVKRKFDE